jgi:UDP-4-amino-4,6-dideoxy-N-acetyl-beta-L-altrosamine transaminase
MIPYSRQSITQEDIEFVTKVLKSDFITQGPVTKNFESSVAKYVEAKFAYAVNSATSALHLSCMALDLTEKDILWTVPNSFVASANCGLYCGAQVDFVDINPQTFNISLDDLKLKLINAKINNKLPKILVTVDFSGQPVEQEEIWKLSNEYNFSIIEDASHAIGAKRNEIKVGNNKWSDITVFSFHPVKMITTGEGGMVLTQNEKYANKIEMLRTHGITRDPSKFLKLNSEPWYYEQHTLGFNYRMSDINAALGLSQLDRIDEFLKKRNLIAKKYFKILGNLPLKLPKIENQNYSSFHLFVIRLNLDELSNSYSEVFNYLRSKNIGVNLHYLPIHLQPIYLSKGFKVGDFPESEKYSKEAISLPIYPEMSDDDQNYIYEELKNILK